MLISHFWRENSCVPSSWTEKWQLLPSKRPYSKKKNWEKSFFWEYVENGEFIAEKIWDKEGFSKVLTTATWTYEPSGYPEKTTEVDLDFWFLSRSFFFAKFWKNNFLSKCGSESSLKNGEFIAEKIWGQEGFSKIWTTETWTCKRPGYPEKTTEFSLDSIARVLLVNLKFFFCFGQKKLLENILIQNLLNFKNRFLV